MVDHGAALLSLLPHRLSWVLSVVYISPFSYHIDVHALHHGGRTGSAQPTVCPDAQNFKVMGDVANLFNARFAPKRLREMTSRPIDRP
jgi:hypothetical protein